MGMGAFAGAALIVPRVATIFDMGRDTGLAAPPTAFFSKAGYIGVFHPATGSPWLVHEGRFDPRVTVVEAHRPADPAEKYDVILNGVGYKMASRSVDPRTVRNGELAVFDIRQ